MLKTGARHVRTFPTRLEPVMPSLSPAEDTKDPDHSLQERAAAASPSTRVSVAANLVLTTTQRVAGVLATSQGLIAHVVVPLANHPRQKDADEGHRYGPHRFETAARLVPGATLRVEAGHDRAVDARGRVMPRHRVRHRMTQAAPWQRPDLDHAVAMQPPAG